LTDKLTGPRLVEKTFVYMGGLVKDCRAAVTSKFMRENRGLPFDSVEAVLKREIESWFATRDKNMQMSLSKSEIGRPGEVLITYSGATKDAHFKVYVNGLFTLVDSPGKTSPSSYMKSLSLSVDKRDFTR
jgi:hypothetical protein